MSEELLGKHCRYMGNKIEKGLAECHDPNRPDYCDTCRPMSGICEREFAIPKVIRVLEKRLKEHKSL